MFTTFPRSTKHDGSSKQSPSTTRPKRSQVHRACDWCKLIRTKCDNHRPCDNCKQSGRECVTNGQNHFRSIAAATREVERLRAQVRHLENRVEHSQQPPPVVSPTREHDKEGLSNPSKGVRLNSIYYGASSLPFFLKRLSAHLETELHHPQIDVASQTGGTSTPVFELRDQMGGELLGRAQEDHFLDVFWQIHHFSYPVINELDFRIHYQALWSNTPPGAPRQPSALVEIVLALCMQLGSSFLAHTTESSTTSSPFASYPSLAGFQYYQRCQSLLCKATESPTVTTVQCYILSIVYLCEAGLFKTAQLMKGKASAVAMMLGLNNEPQSGESEPQKELMRRTWWSLYILDAELSIKEGRTFTIFPSQSACRLPSESPEIARSLGPQYMSNDSSLTWLGFQSQTLRLLDTVKRIWSAFYSKCDAEIGEHDTMDFASNGAAREECARFLTEQMKTLTAWTTQVSTDYLAPRRGGESLSIDRSPLIFDHTTPVYYQRHRILLELQYHFHAMTLYRPFICFAQTPETSTPLSNDKAMASVNHAIALITITQQALLSSEILTGSNLVFHWLKSALFTTIGFAYAYPVSRHITATRKAIEMAMFVVEMYSGILPEASHVATFAHSLANKADSIISEFRSSGYSSDRTSQTERSSPPSPNLPPSPMPLAESHASYTDIPSITQTGAGDLWNLSTIFQGPDATIDWLETATGSSEPWLAFDDTFEATNRGIEALGA